MTPVPNTPFTHEQIIRAQQAWEKVYAIREELVRISHLTQMPYLDLVVYVSYRYMSSLASGDPEQLPWILGAETKLDITLKEGFIVERKDK